MTGIFYGSTTGSTEAVAQDIARLLGVAESDLHNVADTPADESDKYDPVSYTHLTLPTICSV